MLTLDPAKCFFSVTFRMKDVCLSVSLSGLGMLLRDMLDFTIPVSTRGLEPTSLFTAGLTNLVP